jgi:GNAT superfamily N-acetyltransferase
MIRCERIPSDVKVRELVAQWSHAEWQSSFPADTPDTYLQIFAESDASDSELPFVYVAWLEGELVGTASLVVDDELPEATEPGPWLAAMYVHPASRRQGVANALLSHVEGEARRLGSPTLYLYTHDQGEWYARHGWTFLRAAMLNGHTVDVMCKDL